MNAEPRGVKSPPRPLRWSLVSRWTSSALSTRCFPLFATIAGALGLGSLQFLRGNAPVLIQAMTALAFVAAYRHHRRRGPLLASAASVGLVLVAYFLSYHVLLIYGALAGLTMAAIWNLVISRAIIQTVQPRWLR